MSHTPATAAAADAEGKDALIGLYTMTDGKGGLHTEQATMKVSQAEFDAMLSPSAVMDSPLDVLGSYVQTESLVGKTRSRTLTDLVMSMGEEKPQPAPQAAESGEAMAKAFSEDPRPFVGLDLSYKWKPRESTQEGKNPTFGDSPGIRRYTGDEFPRMFCYGAPKFVRVNARDPQTNRPIHVIQLAEEAKPAFWSHFHKINADGTPKLDANGQPIPVDCLEDLKGQKLNINIATKLPDYMLQGDVAQTMKGREKFAFKGQTLEETFTPVSQKVEQVWRKFAKDFEKTTGIQLDVRNDNSESPHREGDINMTVAAFSNGNPQLAGFANFPESMNAWAKVLGGNLGHKQGFMMLNNEYSNHPVVDNAMLYDLIAHEFGHFMGMVHPHDLGTMKMPQGDTYNHTVMAYTDGKFTRFPEREGVTYGVVDMSIRNYVPNPPKLNDAPKQVYDLAAQAKVAFGENYDSTIMARTKQIPAVPIVCNGTDTTLVGTTGNDVLDTEPGHMCRTFNSMGTELRFGLVEGHFSRVRGRAGNNHIFTSSKGNQVIEPGAGKNSVHIYTPDIGGTKTIISTGTDTLVLHEDIFVENRVYRENDFNKFSKIKEDKRLQVAEEGDNLIITGKNGGKIVLKNQLVQGEGVNSVRIVDDEGRTLLQRDVSHCKNSSEFVHQVFEPINREIPSILKRRDEAAKIAAEQGHDDEHGSGHLHTDPFIPKEIAANTNTPATPKDSSFAARLTAERKTDSSRHRAG